jgi:hypothetical protein
MVLNISLLLVLLAASPSGLAQGRTDAVGRALTAAPAQMRDDATVIAWNRDFTYRTLKKGRNRQVCFDLSGMPGQDQPFAVECTSAGNLGRVAEVLRSGADGARTKPEYGARSYRAAGADAAHARRTVSVFVHAEPPIERHVLTPPTPPGLQP